MTAQSPLRLQWLDPRNPREPFPAVENALLEPNGLLAIGGDLSVHRLLEAYRQGIFPWFNPDEPILWWSPDPRAVLDTASIHVSRSLRKRMRREEYAVSLDRAFDRVVSACGQRRVGGTWLGNSMQLAYLELFRRGHAHSVEIWHDGDLVGGLYGVARGRMFFGESMFSRMSDASKLALVHLGRQLAGWDIPLMDCQVGSAHLESLGARYMPRRVFQRYLASVVDAEGPAPGSWQFDVPVPADPRHLPPS